MCSLYQVKTSTIWCIVHCSLLAMVYKILIAIATDGLHIIIHTHTQKKKLTCVSVQMATCKTENASYIL